MTAKQVGDPKLPAINRKQGIPAKDGITAVTVIYCYGNYDVT